MRTLLRNSLFLFLVAHVIACYAFVGGMALLNATTAVAADDGEEDDTEEDWYLRPTVLAAMAPVSVPCILTVAVALTVASPVERFPVSLCGLLLAGYFVPLFVTILTLRWMRGAAGSVSTTPEYCPKGARECSHG